MESFGLEEEFKSFGDKARARTNKTNDTVKKALALSGFMALSPLVGVLAAEPSLDTSTLVALGTALVGAVSTGVTGFAHMITSEKAENMEKLEKVEKAFLKSYDKDMQANGKEAYNEFVNRAISRGDGLSEELKETSKTFKKAAEKRESLINGNDNDRSYNSLLESLKEDVGNMKIEKQTMKSSSSSYKM